MRKEFSKKIKLEAYQRSGGNCENPECGTRLYPTKFHYDHVNPDAMGGEPTLENCRVLCTACHGRKTGEQDIPTIAKSNRQRANHLGLKVKRGPPMPGSKRSRWKKKMDGTVVPR